jgi:hypothetical protein
MRTKDETLTELLQEISLHTLQEDTRPPIDDIVVDGDGVLTAVIFAEEPVTLETISVVLAATGRIQWVGKRRRRKGSQ